MKLASVTILAEIGKPDAALRIEDEIVRSSKLDAVAAVVQPLDFAGGDVDAAELVEGRPFF